MITVFKHQLQQKAQNTCNLIMLKSLKLNQLVITLFNLSCNTILLNALEEVRGQKILPAELHQSQRQP